MRSGSSLRGSSLKMEHAMIGVGLCHLYASPKPLDFCWTGAMQQVNAATACRVFVFIMRYTYILNVQFGITH